MKFRNPALILLLLVRCAFAQTAPPASLTDIKQSLKKLNVLGSVLYVAAHPDDENTRLLAYLAQEKHYRTGYMALTRGDGGQNLIGNDQSELLGLVRTQELLAARRVDGAEQFFSRANDFGFSKGPDETLKIWDREKVLSDLVWVIRKFKPDVIICRFPTTGEGGHGHHTSSAILAQEAFSAAADPKRFPEQLQYVQPWQAKRLLWNTFNFGGANTTAPDQFKIDVGVYNPLLGKGYGEIAADSRSNHKSQGFGSAKQRGQSFEYFKTILGSAPHTDLFDDVNTIWRRIKDGEAIEQTINTIGKAFDENNPAGSVPALMQLLSRVEKVPDAYWRDQKVKELKDLIAACAGLWFEAYAAEPAYAIGDSIPVRAQIIDRYTDKVKLAGITINGISKPAPLSIQNNQLQTVNNRMFAAKLTQPYWLGTPHSIGSYNIPDQQLVGNPENPDLPTVGFEFIIEGKPIRFERRLVYKYVDPVRGEVYQPVAITPPVTANIASPVYVFSTGIPQNLVVKLKSFRKEPFGSIHLKLPKGWKVEPENIDFKNKSKGEEWNEHFTITPTGNQTENGIVEAEVTSGMNKAVYNYGIKTISYEHIPVITLFPPAQAQLLNLNLKLAGKKIGYINGAGDLVPDALRQAGYEVHDLDEKEIMNGDLSQYDAIVTGVRAYNVNNRLVVEQPKLMEYVKNGGNLLVQYNNNQGIVVNDIGPYPFRVVNQRVTDENAKVTVTDPNNPVLNYPNKIIPSDFDGWVQERGLYFTSGADSRYQAPLQMNDPGEAQNNGSLIITDYGKGRFIYTSLSFFRQLPAGVPGAYKLFINMLSKPASPVN